MRISNWRDVISLALTSSSPKLMSKITDRPIIPLKFTQLWPHQIKNWAIAPDLSDVSGGLAAIMKFPRLLPIRHGSSVRPVVYYLKWREYPAIHSLMRTPVFAKQGAFRQPRPVARTPVEVCNGCHRFRHSASELWRIRCSQQGTGLDHVADIRDFAGSSKRGDANAAHGNEVGF